MRSILFVDDEPRILAALERSLWTERRTWKLTFALGAEAALAQLEKAHFDVIVSDMRMPQMDGAQLLERVRDAYPSMGRIILSGQAEQSTYKRALEVAHEFLSKPCDKESLRAALERAFAAKDARIAV